MYSIETQNLIDWLTKRISITEQEKNTVTDFNLMVAKGGKLTVYKELLEHVKVHNKIKNVDSLSSDAKKLVSILEVISNHKSKLNVMKQNRANAESEGWSDCEIESYSKMIEVLASILSDLNKIINE